MSQQLIVSINSDADNFRWCWLGDGKIYSAATGNFDALAASLGNTAQQAWLLLPGAKVVTRRLSYTENEKKHLRNLLPFQLEDSVAGDIDDLHVAIGKANAGQVALAYTDKQWLRSIFTLFGSIGVEITRCWSTPQVLPLEAVASEPVEPALSDTVTDADTLVLAPSPTWVIGLENGQANVRFAEQEGFSVPLSVLKTALDMLVIRQNLEANPPYLILRAAQPYELDALRESLPSRLISQVKGQALVEPWQLDFDGQAIDLCQAEFSQRLPLARWMKLWRSLGILALITLVTYVGVLGFHIYKLNKQNLKLRQQMEAVYRHVIPNGQADDPEKRLRIKLQSMQPKSQGGSVMATLAGILPLISNNPDVTVKVISYSAETGDMSVSVQAHSFNSIDAMRQSISAQGYNAELQGVNTQGDVSTGRLKINKP